ncbi:MAG: hypothetical protein HYS13_11455 [Planctomycetia bacterium]|nr:hypothetical protein [Planctomycetia bacterium]
MQKICFRTMSLAAVAAILLSSTLWSAEKAKAPIKKGEYNPKHDTIELFAGIADGSLEVKLIAKDATEARVFIDNKTGKPVNVKLPEAFVGVLAQAGIPGGGGLGGGNDPGGGGNQGFGGGFGGQGGGGQWGGGGGGNFFNVPPDRIGEIKVPCVCLEHGKKDPKPSVAYVIKPVEAFSTDPALKELLSVYGSGKVSYPVAQAAAWHISNKMSFEELAAKQIRRLNGARYPYFSREQVLAAVQLVATVNARVKEKSKDSEKSGTTSAGALSKN